MFFLFSKIEKISSEALERKSALQFISFPRLRRAVSDCSVKNTHSFSFSETFFTNMAMKKSALTAHGCRKWLKFVPIKKTFWTRKSQRLFF